LIFADPVYAKTDERLKGTDSNNSTIGSRVSGNLRSFESLHSLSRLPGSDKEAVSIAKVIGSDNATIRSGFEANRQSVLAPDVTNFKIIHFAAHGLIEEDRPELSGIVLSLFDRAGEPQDGGIIRLQDVYGMRLSADIVVLSACDTGMGKEVKGEGLVSLNNAFIQAGARTVISSLWKVDDTATQVLMTEFYRTLVSDRLTAAAALRNAQLKMYRDPRFRSPFYWASFTAHGDMWKVPALENHIDYRYIILPILLILLVGIYLAKTRRGSD
ncbi:MAG: CHAT domain-containing protein, partial [Pyrinomonadaceae bacterium]